MPKKSTKTEVMTEEEIVRKTESIKRRSATLQQDIHLTAMGILAIWQKKGAKYAARAGELLTGLQGASPYHADAFSKWVGEFTDLLWASETETWYAPKEGVVFKGKALVAARETPFYKFKPASKPKPFEFFEALEGLIQKATNDRKKRGDASTVDLKALHDMREIARTMQLSD